MRFYTRTFHLRGFLAICKSRENNTLEGALRGARLRLARDTDGGGTPVPRGSARTLRAGKKKPISRRFLAADHRLGQGLPGAP